MITKQYIRIVFASCFVLFILNKFAFRPFLTASYDSGVMLTIAYSLPNFLEAMMGTMLISSILSFCRQRFPIGFFQLGDSALFLAATLIAATYVLSQEFKFHDIGGNNVYDSNDVAASVLGLITAGLMLTRFGLTSPRSGLQSPERLGEH